MEVRNKCGFGKKRPETVPFTAVIREIKIASEGLQKRNTCIKNVKEAFSLFQEKAIASIPKGKKRKSTIEEVLIAVNEARTKIIHEIFVGTRIRI